MLGAIPEAPRTCRSIIRAALRVRGLAGLADDAEIVVTELASNAVQAMWAEEVAGRIGGDMPIIVLVLGWPAHGVRIEVWDQAPGLPRMREPDWGAEQGRGLFLVHQLTAGRWGCRQADAAKCVWAELTAGKDRWSGAGSNPPTFRFSGTRLTAGQAGSGRSSFRPTCDISA